MAWEEHTHSNASPLPPTGQGAVVEQQYLTPFATSWKGGTRQAPKQPSKNSSKEKTPNQP